MTQSAEPLTVLVLNPGSATLKATVLAGPEHEPRFEQTIDWAADASEDDRRERVEHVLGSMRAAGVRADEMGAVGYRVVHGGERFVAPTLVDDDVVSAIDELADLAPLHNPLAASTIRAGRSALPGIAHVAAFDTAFHASLPAVGVRYPVPDSWVARGIRRYGFHGLSVTWSVRRAAELLERPAVELRLVVAHLGGGSSVTAVDGGRSADTSMGMTPLEGLMMGTRSGSIDPGAILRLLREGVPLPEIARDLEHRSGLLGVSGQTADMRELLALEATGDVRASLATELFVRRAAAGIGAVATALPTLDALVFTGGIGENSPAIRRRVVERLGVLGIGGSLADGRGQDDQILRQSPAVIRVGAREDLVIAEAARDLVGSSAARA